MRGVARGVTRGPDKRDNAARQPGQHENGLVRGKRRHQRWHPEDAGADDDADYDGDDSDYAERRTRLSRAPFPGGAHLAPAGATPSLPMRICRRAVCFADHRIARWPIASPDTVTLPSIVSPLTRPRKRWTIGPPTTVVVTLKLTSSPFTLKR